MEEIVEGTQRKTGEMFTASFLNNATPYYQFLFVSAIGLSAAIFSKYILQSSDLVFYACLFGVIFYVMFNPWLCLLAKENKPYILKSLLYYVILLVGMFGLMYFWTGKHLGNSWELKVILGTTIVYMLFTYLMMMGLKFFFVDVSGGGL